MERTDLRGRYTRHNVEFLQKQAQRGDPRDPFYQAMLKHDTYEAYLADVGQKKIELPGRVVHAISGRMEILYARRNGWIKDT